MEITAREQIKKMVELLSEDSRVRQYLVAAINSLNIGNTWSAIICLIAVPVAAAKSQKFTTTNKLIVWDSAHYSQYAEKISQKSEIPRRDQNRISMCQAQAAACRLLADLLQDVPVGKSATDLAEQLEELAAQAKKLQKRSQIRIYTELAIHYCNNGEMVPSLFYLTAALVIGEAKSDRPVHDPSTTWANTERWSRFAAKRTDSTDQRGGRYLRDEYTTLVTVCRVIQELLPISTMADQKQTEDNAFQSDATAEPVTTA